jgi:hypothetical protein
MTSLFYLNVKGKGKVLSGTGHGVSDNLKEVNEMSKSFSFQSPQRTEENHEKLNEYRPSS